MRVENTNVKLTIPIPIDKPDANGIIYTEEAIENALNSLRANLPIVFSESMEDNEKVIGATGSSHIAHWDYENKVCNVTIDGVLFYSGAEIVVNDMTKDGEITDFRIASIGLTI